MLERMKKFLPFVLAFALGAMALAGLGFSLGWIHSPAATPEMSITPITGEHETIYVQDIVQSVHRDGVTVRYLREPVFLTGHPKQNELAEGDQIVATAQQVGVYRFHDSKGASRALQAYKIVKLE